MIVLAARKCRMPSPQRIVRTSSADSALQVVRRIALVLLLVAGATGSAAAPDPVYRIDSERTVAGFSVNELGLWQRTGRFGQTRGQIRYDADAESGSIELAVDAASVDTGWSLRDEFVRGEHMLDAGHHPQFRFRSTALRFDAHRLVAVDGLLTLREVTLPVRFRVTDVRCGAPRADGGERCDAAISGSISRRAFGMDFAYPLIGDDVRFDFAVSAERIADARSP
jgi:polyisoprenoid-binding protein YceI